MSSLVVPRRGRRCLRAARRAPRGPAVALCDGPWQGSSLGRRSHARDADRGVAVLGRSDGRCQFSTWLYGILRHRFLKGRRRSALSFPYRMLLTVIAMRPARPIVAETSEDAQRVRQAVASLPEEHRLVVELRFFAGATLDEIATALDCPLGTVKSRLHHGLEKLRRMNLAVNLFMGPGKPGEKTMNDPRHRCEPWAEQISLAAAGCLSADEEREVHRHSRCAPTAAGVSGNSRGCGARLAEAIADRQRGGCRRRAGHVGRCRRPVIHPAFVRRSLDAWRWIMRSPISRVAAGRPIFRSTIAGVVCGSIAAARHRPGRLPPADPGSQDRQVQDDL